MLAFGLFSSEIMSYQKVDLMNLNGKFKRFINFDKLTIDRNKTN